MVSAHSPETRAHCCEAQTPPIPLIHPLIKVTNLHLVRCQPDYQTELPQHLIKHLQARAVLCVRLRVLRVIPRLHCRVDFSMPPVLICALLQRALHASLLLRSKVPRKLICADGLGCSCLGFRMSLTLSTK